MDLTFTISAGSQLEIGIFNLNTSDRIHSLEERIKKIIDKQLKIVLKDTAQRQTFMDPVSFEEAIDPTVTRCGHLFSRSILEDWAQAQGMSNVKCPLCKEPIPRDTWIPLHAEVKNPLPNNYPIPVFSEGKEIDSTFNTALANHALSSARIHGILKNFEKAIESYKEAFNYVNSSESYEEVPSFYERLGLEENRAKAVLANLHLALYQFREGISGEKLEEQKLFKALDTLEHCKELDPKLSIDPLIKQFKLLITGLNLSINPLPEKMEEALRMASQERNPEDSSYLYKEIINCDPYEFRAYIALEPLLKTFQEKMELFLRAAACAEVKGEFTLAMDFRNKIQSNLPTSIGVEDWSNPVNFSQKLPAYPEELKKFLKGPCPIWGPHGKLAKETHVVFPLFKNIRFIENGVEKEVPNTLENLSTLDQQAGGVGFHYIRDCFRNLPKESLSEEAFEWVVMTKRLVPDSESLSYEEQELLVQQYGYQVPTLLEAASGILFEQHRTSDKRERITLGSNRKEDYTARCHSVAAGYQSSISGFNSRGLYVDASLLDNSWSGILGVRRFKAIDFNKL